MSFTGIGNNMSRTLKDRPYWVLLNDPEFSGRTEDHDHVSFGKEITRRRYIKDENGKQVYETIGTPDKVWYTKLSEQGVYVYAFGILKTEIPVWETIVVGHMADHCTVDVPESDERYSRDLLPCGHRTEWNYWKSINRPHKNERRIYHATYKAMERTALINSRKNYNAGEDLEDWDEDEVYSTRTTHHSGYWD